MAGKFITVEGSEGAGKTTALNTIVEQFKYHGIQVTQTREPGGTPLAEEIRSTLLSARAEPVDDTAELLLFFAARAQHINTRIIPLLEDGVWVVCDRFTDSTAAYQGYARGLGMGRIETLENFTQGDFRPDHVILLDVDPTVGRKRIDARAGENDRMEKEKIAFHEKVREGFYERVKKDPSRYHIIDANKDQDHVTDQLHGLIDVLVSAYGETALTRPDKFIEAPDLEYVHETYDPPWNKE